METRVIETGAREPRAGRDDDRLDVDDDRWIEGESASGGGRDRGGWDDDEPIAPRPRGRLLRPLPLALIAVTIAAAGFLGGVEAQKGSESGGAGSFPGGGSLPSFASGTPTSAAETGTGGAEASGGEGASGAAALPSFGGAETAATGTVTSVEGHTVYVKEADGTIVAVKAGDGSTVTRASTVAAKKVHPGDTVVVQGSKHGSTVRASSIAATESGVESTPAAPTTTAPGGGGAGNEGSGSEAEASVESLFEE